MATASRSSGRPPAKGANPADTETREAWESLLAVRLRNVHNTLHKSAIVRYRRELGLTAAEWRSIVFVGVRGASTVGSLSDLLQVDRSLVSRLVDSLAAKGLVTRVKEDADRRRSVVSLTDGGQKVYQHIRRISRERDAALLTCLGEKDYHQAQAALAKIEVLALTWIDEEESKGATDID